MRIAIASKDGNVINQHFGHADRFLIYEVIDEKIGFLEERKVGKYCSADPDRFEAEDVLMGICGSLKDCEYLLVSRIGYLPEKALSRIGIKTVMMYDRIEEGIMKVMSSELGVRS